MFRSHPIKTLSLSVLTAIISATSVAEGNAEDIAEGNAENNAVKQAHSLDYDISFDLEVGTIYDSHLSIEEIDRNTDKGDSALYYQGALKGELKPVEKLLLTADYQYSSKAYQDIDEFDQTLGILNLDGSYQFDWLTLGINAIDVNADLSEEPFLTLTQQGLYVSKLFNNRYFIRLAKNNADKRFEQQIDRNAEVNEFNAGFFLFFDNAQQFIHIGYTDKFENASADEFDYDSYQLALKYSKKFQLFSQKGQWKAGVRRTVKDYRNDSSIIDEPRQDKRNVAEIEVELGLMNKVSLMTKLELLDNQSNLESQDYQSEQVSVLLKVDF